MGQGKTWLWLTLLLLLSSQTEQATAKDGIQGNGSLKFNEITIAFRADAAPFSSLSSSTEEPNLYDFEGYVVTICRRALREVLSSAPHFRGANVIVKEFSPDEISSKSSRENGGDADIFCGPTSITQKRMEEFYVSMPVYLTGIAVAKHPLLGPIYPKIGNYCKPIVGLVKNTTAYQPGLGIAANNRQFNKFSQIVSQLVRDGILDKSDNGNIFLSELRGSGVNLRYYCEGVPDYEEDKSNGEENVAKKEKIVRPIRLFDNHSAGLASFCRGEFLYYLADIDIISDYLSKNKESCSIDLERKVLVKEHYGIFFKKDVGGEDYLKSILLYAYFNLALSKLNREGDGLFMEAYRATFKNRTRTPELENFFQSTSYGIR